MFNSQVECSSLLNIVIQIKGNNYLIRISFVELYREQFLLIRIYGIDVCSLTFVTYKNFWLQEEYNYKRIFSWKWEHVYFCNVNCLTSHFVSGFIGTGHLLLGRNYLMIFLLESVLHFFNISYSIFRICIFVAFCFIQSVALFSAFLVDISACSHCVAADFLAHFVTFVFLFQLKLSFILLKFSLNFCLF